jgi:hypothetical protein
MRFFKLKIKMPKFVTCINCIDGRTQLPVIEFLRRKYDVDFVDLITIPGADGVLAGGEKEIIELVKKMSEFQSKRILHDSWQLQGTTIALEIQLMKKYILKTSKNALK